MMWAIMMANIFIELGWLSALAFCIHSNHNGWAVACFIGAIFCGYKGKSSTQKATGKVENK